MSLLPLLHAASSGDAAAREQLVRELYPRVARQVHALLEKDYRTHNGWILPLFSTGDIVQELFVGLLAELTPARELPADDTALAAFLAARIKNRIVDRLRFHSRQRRDARRHAAHDSRPGEDAPGGQAPSTSHCASLDERLSLWHGVLGELDARERTLWQLRFDQELPFDAIASTLGYKNAESARAAFRALRARLAVRLRRLGLGPTEEA